MKKLIYQFLVLIALGGVLFVSCENKDEFPITPLENLDTGALPRLLSLTSDEIPLKSLASSEAEYTVEFIDKNNGADVAEYVVDVSFDDKTYFEIVDTITVDSLMTVTARDSIVMDTNGIVIDTIVLKDTVVTLISSVNTGRYAGTEEIDTSSHVELVLANADSTVSIKDTLREIKFVTIVSDTIKTGSVELARYSSSAFTSGGKYPRLSTTHKVSDILAALSISDKANLIYESDQFDFSAYIIMADGTRYDQTNSSRDLTYQGGWEGFSGLFDWSMTFVDEYD